MSDFARMAEKFHHEGAKTQRKSQNQHVNQVLKPPMHFFVPTCLCGKFWFRLSWVWGLVPKKVRI
jgi:hypothetical protein